MKQCTRCRSLLPDARFATLKDDGKYLRLASWCHTCTNVRGPRAAKPDAAPLAQALTNWSRT